MLGIIFTWVGTILGMLVLLAMALGNHVVELNDALHRRHHQRTQPAEREQPQAPVA